MERYIEVMPMGDMGEAQRVDQYWPLSDLRARLAERFTLVELDERTGGPARYLRLAETGQKIGLITPLTRNFCESCNSVRLTCTGELYMCLGQEDMADLRAPLRASASDAVLEAAIRSAITRKPKGHDFDYSRGKVAGQVSRHMSHTGVRPVGRAFTAHQSWNLRFKFHVQHQPPPMHRMLRLTVSHPWTPPSVQVGFERFKYLIGCGHVSGLGLRRLTRPRAALVRAQAFRVRAPSHERYQAFMATRPKGCWAKNPKT